MEHLRINLNRISTLSAKTTVLNCLLYLNSFSRLFLLARYVLISNYYCSNVLLVVRPALLDGALDMGIGGLGLLS